MILVWGSTSDSPVAHVLEALDARSADVVFLDDAVLDSLRFDLSIGPVPTGWLEIDGRHLDIGQIGGAYLRPGEQFGDGASVAAALLAVFGNLPSTIVNRPMAGRSNLAKPFQLSLLAAAGLAIPDTLVTNDEAAARQFLRCHGRIVYKSISGIRSVVSAIGVDAAGRLDGLGHGPVQLQEWIEGLDVRVHVVGDRWFATSIVSDATDYRYGAVEGKEAELAPFPLPDELGRHLATVSRDLGLLVAGIDLRRTPSGEWYCFEVNPSPGFTYYEEHTGQAIGGAIAELLSAE